MAKLNGASSLPAEAQNFLAGYKKLLDRMTDGEASDTTINLIYRSYYAEMGGVGTAPDVRAHSSTPMTDNVTAFRRPPAKRPKAAGGTEAKPKLPVALIFACLVVVYAGFRYLMR